MAKKQKPMSRKTLVKGVRDLAERLHDLSYFGEAVVEAERPQGTQTVLEHRVRTVLCTLQEAQLKQLRDIEGFARILAERSR